MRDDHDLVVLADDRRQGLQELLNGSTCVNVMRKCPCPVWIVRPSSTPRIGTVLALVAPPPQTEPAGLDAKVLRCAAEVARGHGATLQVLKAWEVNGPEAEILRAEAPVETRRRIVECHLREHRRAVDELLTLVDLTGIDHEVRLPRGDPRQVIPELTDEHEPDLIVMGSSARATLTDILFGCTTEVVFARVDCAVLAVKPDGFVSPLALPGY